MNNERCEANRVLCFISKTRGHSMSSSAPGAAYRAFVNDDAVMIKAWYSSSLVGVASVSVHTASGCTVTVCRLPQTVIGARICLPQTNSSCKWSKSALVEMQRTALFLPSSLPLAYTSPSGL